MAIENHATVGINGLMHFVLQLSRCTPFLGQCRIGVGPAGVRLIRDLTAWRRLQELASDRLRQKYAPGRWPEQPRIRRIFHYTELPDDEQPIIRTWNWFTSGPLPLTRESRLPPSIGLAFSSARAFAPRRWWPSQREQASLLPRRAPFRFLSWTCFSS